VLLLKKRLSKNHVAGNCGNQAFLAMPEVSSTALTMIVGF